MVVRFDYSSGARTRSIYKRRQLAAGSALYSLFNSFFVRVCLRGLTVRSARAPVRARALPDRRSCSDRVAFSPPCCCVVQFYPVTGSPLLVVGFFFFFSLYAVFIAAAENAFRTCRRLSRSLSLFFQTPGHRSVLYGLFFFTVLPQPRFRRKSHVHTHTHNASIRF